MCGIAGMVSFDGKPVSLDDLQKMCAVTSHRGPDDYGFYADDHAVLGMRRLSIIDLATGRQPVHNEDGTVWVVFNGEIYNYRQLARELKRKGHVFYTSSDTEVIVHLYEEHGPAAIERLRGMFAFALWDQKRRQLLLARDRFGIKPLYYAEVKGRLVFASELKAILQLPEVERRLDWSSVEHLFSWLCTPSTDSIIAGIHKLEPANLLIAAPGHSPRLQRYWDLHFAPDHGRSEEYFVEKLMALLKESVQLHMVSEVPVGAFMSGGIDSSSVVAMMSQVASSKVKTFSIGFPDEDYSELAQARLVAKRFGTDHHEMIVEPEMVGILDDIAWHLDEPFGDSSAIPTYMVSKLASQHVKVVLSGDGGDEIFAGYDKYLVERGERRFDRLPEPVRRALGVASWMMPHGMKGRNLLRHLSITGARRYLDALTLFRLEEMKSLFRPEAYEQITQLDPARDPLAILERASEDWLWDLQYFDLRRYLPLDILTKVDRMSMAHSIEARVPLLDHKLVEFLATIPSDLKLRGKTTKYILKRAMRGIVPDVILDGPKRGFAIPLGRWFRGSLRTYVNDLLLSDACRQRGIFEPSRVESLLKRHGSGRDLDLQLWTLVSFELWCRTFLDTTPAKGRIGPRDPGRSFPMKAVS
jgi:asparagine synthase (glutamine-hydrolysing)